MGTISQFFQPPLYWQQFEELAVGMLREVYDVPGAQSYGRPGQAQHGVDVYGKSRHGMIGIQCKRLSDLDERGNPYPGGPIDRSFLHTAAREALSFKPDLNIWILATTARRDTRVQGFVDDLNGEWDVNRLARRAIVWSWDECISYLNSFPELQRWYYRDVIQVRGADDLDEVILRTIAMAFERPAFEVPLHCETPDEFFQALKDTQQALRTGELVDRESRHVIRKAVGGYREVQNRELRDRLGGLNGQLRQLRSRLEEGLKDGTIRRVNNFLGFVDPSLARSLADVRDKCRRDLNDLLQQANIPTI